MAVFRLWKARKHLKSLLKQTGKACIAPQFECCSTRLGKLLFSQHSAWEMSWERSATDLLLYCERGIWSIFHHLLNLPKFLIMILRYTTTFYCFSWAFFLICYLKVCFYSSYGLESRNNMAGKVILTWWNHFKIGSAS